MFIIALNLLPQVNFHRHHQMAVFNFFAFTVDGFIITFFLSYQASYQLCPVGTVQHTRYRDNLPVDTKDADTE